MYVQVASCMFVYCLFICILHVFHLLELHFLANLVNEGVRKHSSII